MTGIVAGIRTLSDGEAEYWPDEGWSYKPSEYLRAYIVYYDIRRKPAIVPVVDAREVTDLSLDGSGPLDHATPSAAPTVPWDTSGLTLGEQLANVARTVMDLTETRGVAHRGALASSARHLAEMCLYLANAEARAERAERDAARRLDLLRDVADSSGPDLSDDAYARVPVRTIGRALHEVVEAATTPTGGAS
jgi:hypothetical protein